MLFSTLAAGAQTAKVVPASCYVTELISDYGGFWQSGTGTGTNAATSTVKPDNSHNLLAFVLNSGQATVNGAQVMLAQKYFSTGVNNALLDSKGLAGHYNTTQYQALSLSNVSSINSTGSLIALGQKYDGVDAGASSPPPAAGFAQYLVDGTRGLDLGTGVANLPSGTLEFGVSSVNPAAIDDGVPDILITQIADPSSSTDKFSFLDASNSVIPNTNILSATFSSVPIVGNWQADFYSDKNGSMSMSIVNSSRALRLVAIDFAVFGITSANYSSISRLRIELSGTSDQAFIAYNSSAVALRPLPVTLTAFDGVAQGGRVRLSWQTASERDADAFIVEASPDGQAFAPVGRVAAAGTTSQSHQYQFEHQPAQPGVGYYRLRQLDFDGTAHYSPVVAVRTGAAAVEVFPSIFDQSLTVHLPAAGTTTLTLLAPDGRVLHQQQLAAAEAQHVALPGVAALPPGLYLLRTVVDGQPSLHRVVKR